MAVEPKLFSFPHDSAIDVNGALVLDEMGQPDRLFNSDDVALYFEILLRHGVFPYSATPLQVMADVGNMYVRVMEGMAHVKGRFFKLYEAPLLLLILQAHPTQPRKDIIVIGYDAINRSMDIYVKSGSPSANPQEPPMTRTNDVWEIKLSVVNVRAGTQSIIQGDVQDTRGIDAVCGWVTSNFPPIDTTNWFNQLDSWLQYMKDKSATDWNKFISDFQRNQIDLWLLFMNDIRGILSGDIAGNLALRITDAERNMFLTRDIDNPLHWDGGQKLTTFLGTQIIATWNRISDGGRMAEKTTTFIGDDINSTIRFFELNGVTFALNKTFRTTFNPDGSVSTIPA